LEIADAFRTRRREGRFIQSRRSVVAIKSYAEAETSRQPSRAFLGYLISTFATAFLLQLNKTGLNCRISDAFVRRISEFFQRDLGRPDGARKIFCFPSRPNHRLIPRCPAPHERGVSRSSRTLGAGCGGRGCAFDEQRKRGRRSRVVLTPRRWRQVALKVSARRR
jgi:hypothetical protein